MPKDAATVFANKSETVLSDPLEFRILEWNFKNGACCVSIAWQDSRKKMNYAWN